MTDMTILLVDDSRVARMMTGAAIMRLRPNWRIVEAASGEEALAAAAAAAPDFVLMDVNMPGIGGMAAATYLRRDYPQAAISLLTANIQDPIREQADRIGVGFLIKPLREDALAHFLDSREDPS
ncbi:response regulator [Magnetospirillum molischianum]|uniref:Putative two-component response transcriptional regulator (CheY family) n=1 Tax=Magnetospirillum molischianum DSM 120 TaxID=1150626 RepID=H8FN85_MAGML